VITARHCISNFVDLPFACTSAGELSASSDGGETGEYLAVTAIGFWTGTNPPLNGPPAARASRIFAPSAASICRNDIAAVLLDTALSELPLAPIRWSAGNEPADLVRVVGYGGDETNTAGVRRTRSGLQIAAVGPNEFRPNGDPIVANTFMTIGPSLCIGDSGGPAFADSGALTGVWSRFVGPCDSSTVRNIFTEVAPFTRAFWEEAFEASGYEPVLETPPGGGGTGGTGPADGGEAGETTAGEGGTSAGGSAGTGSAAGLGGSAGSGGSAAGAAPVYRGPRTKGGCRCDVAGGASRVEGFGVVPLLALASLGRRLARRRCA
jgi:hypothetical protein